MKYKQKEEIVSYFLEPTETISEDYFNVASLKNAVWQYLIDHSRIVDDNNLLKIDFYMPNEGEFWYRVKARERGDFKRTDLIALRAREHKKHLAIQKIRQELNIFKDQNKEKDRIALLIAQRRKNGTIYQKTVLNLSQKSKKLYKYLQFLGCE